MRSSSSSSISTLLNMRHHYRLGRKRNRKVKQLVGTEAVPTFAVALLLLFHTASTTAFTVFGERLRDLSHNGTHWPVTVATFGNQLENYDSFDLVLPPEGDTNGTLCSVPSVINASMENAELFQYTYSIGLFVAVGECSPEIKARNLLSIQKVIPRVDHLVVYGTDPSKATAQIIMFPDSLQNENELDNMVAIYVPTDYAAEIIARMWVQAKEEQKSPFFLDAQNEEFWFRVNVKNNNFHDHTNSNTRGGPNEDQYDESYLWFRFVLFSLLIVAPFARAMYLWYQGGGRLIWRRDEQRRIIGLQYIPPVPYWLAAGRFISNQETATFILTEEQFASLPEIKFEPVDATEPSDSSRESDEGGAPDHSDEKPKPTMFAEDEGSIVNWEDKDRGVEAACDVDKPVATAVNDSSIQRPKAGPALVVSAAPDIDATPHNEANPNTTTCTACSICIDDFEEGETLVLLPRCRHAFHKECLKPWLLERQGCCPLCKTEVLPPGDQITDDSTPSLDGEEQSVAAPISSDHPSGGRVSTPDDASHRSV